MSFWYLATVYSQHPRGYEEAFIQASKQAGLLLNAKVPVFCPIAHTHPIERYSNIPEAMNPTYNFWVEFVDKPFIDAAKGLIVCKMENWQKSVGIGMEIACFQKANKPIVYMEPGRVPVEFAN